MKVKPKTWRDYARPVIAEVINRVGIDDPKLLRKELSDAYPFFEKENHPYRIWLDEIKRQLGQLPPLGQRKPKEKEIDPNQIDLFGELK